MSHNSLPLNVSHAWQLHVHESLYVWSNSIAGIFGNWILQVSLWTVALVSFPVIVVSMWPSSCGGSLSQLPIPMIGNKVHLPLNLHLSQCEFARTSTMNCLLQWQCHGFKVVMASLPLSSKPGKMLMQSLQIMKVAGNTLCWKQLHFPLQQAMLGKCYHHSFQQRGFNTRNVCQSCCQVLASSQDKKFPFVVTERSLTLWARLIHPRAEDNERFLDWIKKKTLQRHVKGDDKSDGFVHFVRDYWINPECTLL